MAAANLVDVPRRPRMRRLSTPRPKPPTLSVKVRQTARGLVLEHKHGPMPPEQLRSLWQEVLELAQREALADDADPLPWPATAPVVLTTALDV